MLKQIAFTTAITIGVVYVASAQRPAATLKNTEHKKASYSVITDSLGDGLNWTDTVPGDSCVAKFATRAICKKWREVYLVRRENVLIPDEFLTEVDKKQKTIELKNAPPLLKVSGNILYDVNYRSRIDTPYAAHDLYQHTLQTRIDAVYKDRYPFRLYLTTRFSNSDLFRKYTDLNFQFNQSDFKRMLKANAINAIDRYVASKTGSLDSLKKLIEDKRAAFERLRQSIHRPDLNQQIVEEREKAVLKQSDRLLEPDYNSVSDDIAPKYSRIYKKQFQIPSGMADSLIPKRDRLMSETNLDLTRYEKERSKIEAEKQKLDSLSKELEKAEMLYRNLRSVRSLDADVLKREVEGAADVNSLVSKLHTAGIPDTVLPKGYKTLFAIQSLSVGRSTADYSELSVRNISITGFQVEYNPRYYYAVAAGKVDYRFRDYIVTNNSRSHQFLALARVGKGNRNGTHIFFTYYTGKRQFFNGNISSQPGSEIPEYKLAGITIEATYKISPHISLTGEIAKSTMPYYSRDSLLKAKWMNAVTDINNRTNEAYSVKLISYFPKTHTRFSGNIRYTGANFQSFSTFTTGASQLRWAGRVEQPFFRKKLTLLSSVQQNDYYNPFVATNYKTSALLASFQANLRIKKWPVISVGFYPSYQLAKTGNDKYSESRYYTLSASAGYSYKIQAVQLSSYLVYSRFYNTAVDSGFVYYNSRNYLWNQQFNYNQFNGSMNLSVSLNTDYNINTMESTGQWDFNKWITAGLGLKLVRHSLLEEMFFGYSANINLRIPKLGDLQLMADKGFIPGLNRTLAENKMGRLTYYKTF